MRALILPGGGARGVYQTGSIHAFMEQYGSFDFIAGTSVGALNGTLVAQGELDKLTDLWKNIKNSDIFKWNPFKMFGTQACLADTTPLANLIHNSLDINKLKIAKPFYASTTRINPLAAVTQQVNLMSQSEAEQWVLASASAPLAFPVQQINGQQYSDGGLSRNFGIEQAVSLGATELIVLCCSAINSKQVKNLLDMLALQMSVQAASQFHNETELVRILNRSQHMVSLTVYKPDSVELGQLDFSGASKNYEKYFNLGVQLLKKPAVQFRKVMQAGAHSWMIYK